MNIRSDLLTWGIGLLIAVPVLVIIFSEIIVQLERRQSPYARFWRRLRDLVLPLLTAFLIARQMLMADTLSNEMRLLESVLWAVIAYALGSFIGAMARVGSDRRRWEAAVPALFRGLLRVVVFGVPVYYIASEIWGLQLNDLLSALGVGSLVIALALQDTLSSIVSGFLLTLDRPFEEGDYILVEGRIGKVLDLNWRSVRVEINGRDVIIVPNAQLASQTIYNYTARDRAYRDEILVDFSFDDSPNLCRQVLIEAALTSPYVLEKPAPSAFLHSFDASGIRYQLMYHVAEYKGSTYQREVASDVRTRIYYVSRRAGLTMPNPIVTVEQVPSASQAAEHAPTIIVEALQQNSWFASLPRNMHIFLGERARLQTYGRSEVIVRVGQPSSGLYVILSGDVALTLPGASAESAISLRVGDVFGEMMFFGSRPSVFDVHARTDSVVIFLSADAVNEVLRQQPRFAVDLDRLVNERQRLLESYIPEYSLNGTEESA